MLYFIRQIKKDNMVKNFPNFEVYVDSPLAVEATSIFNGNVLECFDEETMELIRKGLNPLRFEGLKLSVTSNDSIAINENTKPKVILSASGMCEAGRIRHHLKHNLWRENNTILFVGFQTLGTLGRAILEGAKTVKLFGEEIAVNAHIENLKGISGHGDQKQLIKWLQAMKQRPEKVFVVHGEDTVCDIFAELLNKEYGYQTYAPYSGTQINLATGELVKEGIPIRISQKAKQRRATGLYENLVNAGHRLMAVIKRNEGGTNKDIAKFTSQIQSLCDKWDR